MRSTTLRRRVSYIVSVAIALGLMVALFMSAGCLLPADFGVGVTADVQPKELEVSIVPSLPSTNDNLVCWVVDPGSDQGNSNITLTYSWYKNGVPQPELTGDTADASLTTWGDTWKCTVTALHGDFEVSASDEVTIHNSPPTAPAVNITPERPGTNDTIICSVIVPATDPDGDRISYKYAWYRNTVLMPQLTRNTVGAAYTVSGDTWKCMVRATDGIDSSARVVDQVVISLPGSTGGSSGSGTDSGGSTTPEPVVATYYVDPNNGDDDNDGNTPEKAFRTIDHAAGVVVPGDVVDIRGGTYSSSGIDFSTSGTEDKPITFQAYPGEHVIIDGGSQSHGSGQPLVYVMASWNIFRDIEAQNSGGQGVYVLNASDNVFENILTHHNYLSGLQIVNGQRNTLSNVVSHSNYDDGTSGGGANGDNSDGIGISSGSNNVLVGCVVYNNSDDGLDTWESTDNLIERCVSHNNGYANGNGQGFKLGPGIGSIASNTIRNCISFNNKDTGFSANSGGGSNICNNTAFGNGGYQFDSYNISNTLRNNIAYGSRDALIQDDAVDTHNSWNLGIDDPRFLSTDPASPDFMALASGSPAIDSGTDIGLPYSGSSPDLGALEYGVKIGDLVPEF